MQRTEFTWRVMIVIVLLAEAARICFAAKVFLLTFAALLLALLLDFLARRLSALSGFSRRWSFTCVLLALVVIVGGAAWISVPRVADQVSQFVRFTPQAFQQVTDYLQEREWGQTLLQYFPKMLGSVDLAAILSIAVRNAIAGAVGFPFRHGDGLGRDAVFEGGAATS